MKAEYCPAVMNNMTADAPGCDANTKMCGFNDKIDRSEMKEMNFSGCQSLCSEQKKGIFCAASVKNQVNDAILVSDGEFNPELYTDLEILPEDELSMMEVYCKSAIKDGSDVSFMSSLISVAGEKYEDGDIEGFYEIMESFYNLYENLCRGRGGRLYVSGDYLSFSCEPVQVSFSNFYL